MAWGSVVTAALIPPPLTLSPSPHGEGKMKYASLSPTVGNGRFASPRLASPWMAHLGLSFCQWLVSSGTLRLALIAMVFVAFLEKGKSPLWKLALWIQTSWKSTTVGFDLRTKQENQSTEIMEKRLRLPSALCLGPGEAPSATSEA
jgi:hypothetical protein